MGQDPRGAKEAYGTLVLVLVLKEVGLASRIWRLWLAAAAAAPYEGRGRRWRGRWTGEPGCAVEGASGSSFSNTGLTLPLATAGWRANPPAMRCLVASEL